MKLLKRPAAIAAVAALLVVSASAVALRLSAAEVADQMGQHAIARAFADNNAVTVNETVESGGYAITLMGLASGANLDEWSAEVDAGRTYAVVALDRLDGTPLERETFDFIGHTVTPLVSGYAPWAVNSWTLDTIATGTAVNGTFYFLLNTSDLNVFADHTVYLAFYEGGFAPSAETFVMAEDGSIAFAEDYQGAHALFTLPLDPGLADPAAAEAMAAPWLPPASE